MNAAGKSILIIEPEKETARQLYDVFSQEGYCVSFASSGREFLDDPHNFPELIILNPQLPDMNGLDFLRTLKQRLKLSGIPVFILSNQQTEADEIISLEFGADDYITRPVHIPRLLARIRALFRRQDQQITMSNSENDVIMIDDLSILIPQFTVVSGHEYIEFSKKEFEILVYMAKNRGRVLTRQVLFHNIWGQHKRSTNRTIDVHVGRIRKKLKEYAHYIETVPCVGYRLKEK